MSRAARRLRPRGERPGEARTPAKENDDEIHAHDARAPRDRRLPDQLVEARGVPCAYPVHARSQQGPARGGRARRRRGARAAGAGARRPLQGGGRARGNRRSLRRIQGVSRGLLDRGRRERRARLRDRGEGVDRARARRQAARDCDRGAPGDERAVRLAVPMRAAGERLLRELAPQVLGAVVRRYDDFGAAEDAVQEALAAAALEWPRSGVPASPRAWLVQVATRRLTDAIRAASARRRRETKLVLETPCGENVAPPPDEAPPEGDDTLVLLFMCCHPALTRPSAIALTLRAVGGLTTAEIASAFLVPEATMAQRISRAKQSIKSSGVGFAMPPPAERGERLGAVLHVLYLVFNEGYAASSGAVHQRVDLSSEAIRLVRAARELLPESGEVCGLLALMLLTDARRTARSGPHGEIVPLDEQDRSRWDRGAIAEGVRLVAEASSRGPAGSYLLQAAIAAEHDQAARAEDTDWPRIVALYDEIGRA